MEHQLHVYEATVYEAFDNAIIPLNRRLLTCLLRGNAELNHPEPLLALPHYKGRRSRYMYHLIMQTMPYKEAFQAYQSMKEAGIEPSPSTYELLFKQAATSGEDMNTMVEIVQEARNAGSLGQIGEIEMLGATLAALGHAGLRTLPESLHQTLVGLADTNLATTIDTLIDYVDSELSTEDHDVDSLLSLLHVSLQR